MERSQLSSGRSATPADINRNGRPTSIGTGGRHQSECPADIIGIRRQTARNNAVTSVKWQFTTADARIKLKRLYPSFEK